MWQVRPPPPQEEAAGGAAPGGALGPERASRRHWDLLEYGFADGNLLLRQIRPEHAVAAGREYTAAQRARWRRPLMERGERRRPAVAAGTIQRIRIWGEEKCRRTIHGPHCQRKVV